MGLPSSGEVLLVRGLTPAQSMQIGLDAAANPEVIDHLQDFAGKYVDERRELTEAFSTQVSDEQVLALAEGDYKITWQTFDEKSTPVGRAALKAAGQAIRDLKDEHQTKTDKLYDSAAHFSAEMAEFCHERLGGAALTIMGKRYEYDRGYLATILPAKPIPKPLMFANLSAVQRRNSEQITLCPPQSYEIYLTLVRMAGRPDWLQLLGGLQAISKF